MRSKEPGWTSAKLDEPSQKAYLCYVFLATLQELIIQHLDAAILEG